MQIVRLSLVTPNTTRFFGRGHAVAVVPSSKPLSFSQLAVVGFQSSVATGLQNDIHKAVGVHARPAERGSLSGRRGPADLRRSTLFSSAFETASRKFRNFTRATMFGHGIIDEIDNCCGSLHRVDEKRMNVITPLLSERWHRARFPVLPACEDFLRRDKLNASQSLGTAQEIPSKSHRSRRDMDNLRCIRQKRSKVTLRGGAELHGESIYGTDPFPLRIGRELARAVSDLLKVSRHITDESMRQRSPFGRFARKNLGKKKRGLAEFHRIATRHAKRHGMIAGDLPEKIDAAVIRLLGGRQSAIAEQWARMSKCMDLKRHAFSSTTLETAADLPRADWLHMMLTGCAVHRFV
jgi:hypothetical protein